MRSTPWPVVASVVLFGGLTIITSVVTVIFGQLALRHAKTKSRWGIPEVITLYVEPDAFKGKAARYRRGYFNGQLVVLGLVLVWGLVLLAIKAFGSTTG
jgi:hypothetical protein